MVSGKPQLSVMDPMHSNPSLWEPYAPHRTLCGPAGTPSKPSVSPAQHSPCSPYYTPLFSLPRMRGILPLQQYVTRIENKTTVVFCVWYIEGYLSHPA